MIKLTDILSEKIKPKQKISKKEWSKIKKFNKHIGQDGTHYVTQLDKKLGTILFGGNHTDSSTSNELFPASIFAEAADTFDSATDMPTDLVFLSGAVGRTKNQTNKTTNNKTKTKANEQAKRKKNKEANKQ